MLKKSSAVMPISTDLHVKTWTQWLTVEADSRAAFELKKNFILDVLNFTTMTGTTHLNLCPKLQTASTPKLYMNGKHTQTQLVIVNVSDVFDLLSELTQSEHSSSNGKTARRREKYRRVCQCAD